MRSVCPALGGRRGGVKPRSSRFAHTFLFAKLGPGQGARLRHAMHPLRTLRARIQPENPSSNHQARVQPATGAHRAPFQPNFKKLAESARFLYITYKSEPFRFELTAGTQDTAGCQRFCNPYGNTTRKRPVTVPEKFYTTLCPVPWLHAHFARYPERVSISLGFY